MVLESNTGRCAYEEDESQRGWTRGGVPVRILGLERGGLGGSHIDWRREQVLARMLGLEGGRL